MPCEYSVVRIGNRNRTNQRKKAQNKKKQIQSKKEVLIKALVAIGFEPSMQTVDLVTTFILGSSDRGKIEILFNEKDGKFVTHFDGVQTHDQEHEILDKLIDTLKASGLSISVEHYHEKPKLPEFGVIKSTIQPKVKT